MKIIVHNLSPTQSLVVLDLADAVTYGVIGVGQVREIVVPGDADVHVCRVDTDLAILSTLTITPLDGSQVVGAPDNSVTLLNQEWTGVVSVVEVPGIGEVTLPAWASGTGEAAAFFLGFACIGGVLLIKFSLRWFRRGASPGEGAGHGD